MNARALSKTMKAITPDDFNMFHCPFEWHFCVLGCPNSKIDSGLTFFIGKGSLSYVPRAE